MGEEQIRDAYAAVTGLYIELFGSRERVPSDDLALIGRHLTIRTGPVLDVGCGPGHLTAHLRSLGVDATGIDLVPGFIDHARAAHPDGVYRLGSMTSLEAGSGTVAGILAWYSLIHLPPPELDAALTEFRRVLAPGGTLVAGFVDGDDIEAFDHKVVTAYRWPVDAFAHRLARAGFVEAERLRRPGNDAERPQAAIAAVRETREPDAERQRPAS